MSANFYTDDRDNTQSDVQEIMNKISKPDIYYNRIVENKYVTYFQSVGLDQVGSDFLTKDQMDDYIDSLDGQALFSSTYINSQGCHERILNAKLAAEDFKKLGASIKRRSIAITDPDLQAVAKNFTYMTRRQLIEPYKVSANYQRLINTQWVSPKAKPQVKVEKLNASHLKWIFRWIEYEFLWPRTNGLLQLHLVKGNKYHQRIEALEIISKLCTFRQVQKMRALNPDRRKLVPDYAMKELRPIWSNASNRQVYVDSIKHKS